MKNMIRFLIVSLFLTGCMDTAIRLWNGGSYISPQERMLYHQCSDVAASTMIPQSSKGLGYEKEQAWLLEHSKRTVECVQNSSRKYD